jgi:hypothetical protein
MENVIVVIVTVIPRHATEPRGIVQHIVRIIPLAVNASFVNLSSLVMLQFKLVQVSVVYWWFLVHVATLKMHGNQLCKCCYLSECERVLI